MPVPASLSRLRELRMTLAGALPTQDLLDEVARAVAHAAGFATSSLAVLRRTEEFEVVAEITGEESNRYQTRHTFVPADTLERHQRLSSLPDPLYLVTGPREPTEDDVHFVYADLSSADAPDAWQPEDIFGAVYRSPEAGRAVWIQLENPLDGRRPGAVAATNLGQVMAEVGELVLGIDRDLRLQQSLDLAEQSQRLIRTELSGGDLDEVVHLVADGLRRLLRGEVVWLSVPAIRADLTVLSPPMLEIEPSAVLMARTPAALEAAELAWQRGEVVVVAPSRTLPADLAPAHRDQLRSELVMAGFDGMLLVPIGWREQWLGCAVILRGIAASDWTDIELRAAVAIGHDVGGTLQVARMFAREAELSRARSGLLDTLVHELKTPLTAVQGYLELIEDVTGPLPAVLGVRAAAHRVESIAGDLLTLARAQQVSDLGSCDLCTTLDSVVAARSARATDRGQRIEVSMPATPVPVAVDHAVAARIIDHLLSNAMKYGDDGGVVRIEITFDDPFVRLTVVDHGWGITAQDRPHLFEEFRRGSDPRVQALPGAGLGLAIVARLLDSVGGRIALDSTPGEGTSVRVDLPQAGR